MVIWLIMQQLNDVSLALKEYYQHSNPSGFANQSICAYALKIISQFPNNERDLSQFLNENWQLVKGSFFSPTAIPNELITYFLCNVAQHVDAKNPLSQLMPGISVESVSNHYAHLRHLNVGDINSELKSLVLTPTQILKSLQFDFETLNKSDRAEIASLDEKLEHCISSYESSLVDNSPITTEQLNLFTKTVEEIIKISKKHLKSKFTTEKEEQINENLQTFLSRFGFPYPVLLSLLKTHILSDDAKSLIPISVLTEEQFNGINPYSEDYQQLSPSEMDRIHEHSDLTRELFFAVQHLNDLTQQTTNNLYSQLTKLCLVLRINDAHGGRGVQEKAGEGAFVALVEFQQYYQLLSNQQKSQIPVDVKVAIDKLLEVSSPQNSEKPWVDMHDRIETCAGSRREQIENAMRGQVQALMQISISHDKSQQELLRAKNNLDSLKEQLKKHLDDGTYQKGRDELGFKKTLLDDIGLQYHVETLDDLNDLKKLANENLRELLKDNPQLHQEILSHILDMDRLVSFTSGISYENLKVVFEYLGENLKTVLIKPTDFFELTLHHNDLKKLRLLAWHLDPGNEIIETGNLLLTEILGEIRKIKKIYLHEQRPTQSKMDLLLATIDDSIDNIQHFLPQDIDTLCLAWVAAKNHDNEKIAEQLLIEIEKNSQGLNKLLQMAVVIGSDITVEKLLLNEKIDVNTQNDNQQTPLHLVIKEDKTALFYKLINSEGIEVNAQNKDGQTPLHLAILHGDFEYIKLLMDHPKVNIDLEDKFGNTPLMYAVKKGQTIIVKNLLEHKAILDLNGKVLELAIINNHKTVVELLLKKLNYPQQILEQVCEKAISLGYSTIVSLLAEKIESSKNYELVNKVYELLVADAAKKGQYWLFWALLAKRPTQKMKLINQALFIAAVNGQLFMVRELLKSFPEEIDFNTLDHDGLSLLEKSTVLGEYDIVQELLKYPLPAEQMIKAFKLAVDNQIYSLMELFLKKSDISDQMLDYFYQKYQSSALDRVITANRQDLAELLLRKEDIGVHLDHLIAAIKTNNSKCIEMIASRLDLNVQNDKGDTLAHTLLFQMKLKKLRHVSRESFKLLCQVQEIDLSIIDADGKTVLHHLIDTNDDDLILLVLQRNKGISDELIDYFVSHHANTALVYGVDSGRVDVVEKILNHQSIQIDLFKSEGNKATMFAKVLKAAVINGNDDVLRVLLTCPGIDAKNISHGVQDALFDAIDKKNTSVFKILMECNTFNPNIQDRRGEPLLHFAIQKNMPISDLIKHPKINVNELNKNGSTALHLAIKYSYFVKDKNQEYLDMVFQLLTQTNIDVTIKDSEGKTAFDYIPPRYQEEFFKKLNAYIDESSQLKLQGFISSLVPANIQIGFLEQYGYQTIELYQRLLDISKIMENSDPGISEAQLMTEISDYVSKSISWTLKISLWLDSVLEYFGFIDEKDNVFNKFIDEINKETINKNKP